MWAARETEMRDRDSQSRPELLMYQIPALFFSGAPWHNIHFCCSVDLPIFQYTHPPWQSFLVCIQFQQEKLHLHTSFSGLLWKSIIYYKALSLEPLRLTLSMAILQYADDLMFVAQLETSGKKIQSSSRSIWCRRSQSNDKLFFFDVITAEGKSLSSKREAIQNLPKTISKKQCHSWACAHTSEISFPIMQSLRLHWVHSFM